MNKKLIIATTILATTLITGSVYATHKPKEEPTNLPHVMLAPAPSNNKGIDDTPFTIPYYDTIQDRMMNAVDNFKTIKGSYEIVINHLKVDENLYFEVVEGNNVGSYVKVTNNRTKKVTEHKFDGTNLISIVNQKAVDKMSVKSIETGKPLGPRKTKTAKGEPVYINRVDPAFSGPAQDVILPQAYAFWLNDDTNNYQIIGEEDLLQRKVTVIEGVHDKEMAIKHNSTTFKLWVDNETGVLLKLIETNNEGEITNRIEATAIQFNGEIDLDSSSANK